MRHVRVLVAPDCFGSSLTAAQVASTVVDAWRAAAPHDDVVGCPLSDGGPGFVETLRASLGGELVAVTVTGPLGDPVPSAVLVVDDGPRRTAYVESAHAVGLALVPDDRRDPTRTTTRGLGELLVAARDTGARRIVVGLGGSATNDGGAGALVGLGLPDDRGVLGRGGGPLVDVRVDDLGGLRALRDGWSHVELLLATDVDVPLLGLQGASAGFAPQKGATPEQAQELERALATFSRAAVDALGDALRPDLLAAPPTGARPGATRLTHAPGAGAAGGLGFGLALVGGRVVPGAALVADAVGLDARLATADLVVTGEGRFDWQSLHGKVAALVGQRALPHALPAVVIAGQVDVGRREWAAAGLSAAYAVADRPQDVAAALADPVGTLAARVRRVARTWSPA